MSSNDHQPDDRTHGDEESAPESRHLQHNWEPGSPICFTVVNAVSAITGQKTTAMEPLYSVIDPEAVETLMSSSPHGHVHLSFSYEGCTVSIERSGAVVVQTE